ncbi:L-alanine-DL-glutamate epimerase-like protein [Agrobacterium sp. ATCC 31749]|uniref:mandelate racemase/muconate lactonizing enzyme family protein n=1 Tax=Agrobacterium sp. ATCC 31749 TaxID=82789 RepID=UPI00020DBE4E|nr:MULTISPECIES: enolase C-terminal domain-like protein [unclassified Agrobacterium]EGL62094.1 L-alanine-DL-glutamate epimerase-like protein [Agrobacterium sp. ATCC 31749]QKX00500.1 L-alanine-DL-glutamate epimerase [Agrobacterium sp. CGMCC 11546]
MDRRSIINRVEIASCNLPLDEPIYLGTVCITSRDYVCLRVVTESGLEGFAIGYKSGSQLFEGLRALAPRLIGKNALMRQEFNVEGESLRVQARASYVRSSSLIDIALWDVTAKAAEQPLFVMLGGFRREVRSIPIVGFSYNHRPLEGIKEEIQKHLDEGESLIKVMIKGADAVGNTKYLQALSSTFGDAVSFAVDCHWSWRSISEALDTCMRIDDCGLAFLEDPFLPQQWRLHGELRSKLKTQIAVGEDVLDPYAYADLVPNVDILRIDATASGGIFAAMNSLALASAHGRRALPHVFPYLHIHIACAHPAIMGVEYIPQHTGTDPVRSLLREFPKIKRGNFQITDMPGAGCDLHWDAVERSASETCVFE